MMQKLDLKDDTDTHILDLRIARYNGRKEMKEFIVSMLKGLQSRNMKPDLDPVYIALIRMIDVIDSEGYDE